MEFGIFIDQIAILGILALTGWIGTRFKVITEPVKDGLARIIFDITLPLLILTGISGMDLTYSLIKNSIYVLIFSCLIVGLMTLVGYISSRIIRLPDKSASVHMVHTMFGNIVYLGFPLINVLFPGGEGLYYAMLFHLVSSLVMWTAGVNILQVRKTNSYFDKIKNLLNPNTIAFAAGFLLLSLSIKLPSVIDRSLGGLGKTTIYLSMLYIGAMLASINWKEAVFSGQAYLLGFNKLILIPIIGLLIFKGLTDVFSLEPDKIAITVIIIQSAMPCMANIVVLAKIYGADDKMATQNVFITTILSIATLPVVFYLVQQFL